MLSYCCVIWGENGCQRICSFIDCVQIKNRDKRFRGNEMVLMPSLVEREEIRDMSSINIWNNGCFVFSSKRVEDMSWNFSDETKIHQH